MKFSDDDRWNLVALIAILVVCGLLAAFLVSLADAKPGEIVGALGSVIGGSIGAFGSAAAVYIMLKGQRDDEVERVWAAVYREIVELCKSPIGQLGACAGIQTGSIRCTPSQVQHLFHSPAPIIYPAVASLVSRLPRPTLVVTFYAQLQETRGLLAILETCPPDEIIGPGHIGVLTDLLINQCQLAQLILSGPEPAAYGEAQLVAAQRSQTVKMLDEQLAAARLLFPDADSFSLTAAGR
jgi:hypothetical protein